MTTKRQMGVAKPLIYVRADEGARLEGLLSPVALHCAGTKNAGNIARARELGRGEISGSDRLPFERDRDRILHSRQFRKLAGKAQLLIAPNRGDLRTRLTHTMEVYQVATSIARRFNLNVPAVEAIALGHDIGHTPFGHAGEEALNEKLKCIGGFHHAAHSVRSLDRIVYDAHLMQAERTCGLNLTYAVREGILKHGWFEERKTPYHLPPEDNTSWNLAGANTQQYASVEAQTVALADEIAYLNHDIDDLILYGFEKVLSDHIVKGFFKTHAIAKKSSQYENWQKAQQNFLTLLTEDKTTRVKILVRDAIDGSLPRIEKAIQGRTDRKKVRLVDLSPLMREVRNLFYFFFKECVYTDVRIKQKNDRAKERVWFLYDFFEKFFQGNSDLLPLHIQYDLDEKTPWWRKYFEKLARNHLISSKDARMVNNLVASKLAACDVVADLTDREAIETSDALCEAESTSGVEAVDRILTTFPNKRQAALVSEQQQVVRKSLQGLFSLSV